MKELRVNPNDAGQRLDRFVAKAVPLLPDSLLQKYIRLKRIKLNGKGARRDQRLQEGDLLQLYINDEFFEKPREENSYLKVGTPRLNIVYEDENLLLADKKPGILCHSAGTTTPSSPTSRPTWPRRASGSPGRRIPSPRPSATASTATPAASSSPPRTPRPCGSSTTRSGTGRSRSTTSAWSGAGPGPPRGGWRTGSSRTPRKTRSS